MVEIGEYIHLVPFVTQIDGTRFLEDDHSQQESDERLSEEAINVSDTLSAEERDILDRIRAGRAPLRSRGQST